MVGRGGATISGVGEGLDDEGLDGVGEATVVAVATGTGGEGGGLWQSADDGNGNEEGIETISLPHRNTQTSRSVHVTCLAFNPHGGYIVTGAEDCLGRIWRCVDGADDAAAASVASATRSRQAPAFVATAAAAGAQGQGHQRRRRRRRR